MLERKLARDIRARRGAFIALAATSLLGVALFGATYDAYRNLVASYDELFVQTRFADVVSTGGDADAIAAEARVVPGVAAVATREVADLPLRVGDRKLLGRVVEVPRDAAPEVDRILAAGDARATPGAIGVIVEKHLAAAFALRQGSSVEVLGSDGWFRVPIVATATSAEYLWPARSRQEVFVPSDDFGVLFASPDVVSRLPEAARVRQALVLFAGNVDRGMLIAQIETIARSHGATDTFTKDEQPSNAALHEDINGFGELSLLFPLLFLGVSGLATYVLLARVVRMQRSQIGLLFASGFSRRTVFRHYLAFGLAATLAGAIPGVLLGAVLGGAITGEYTSELGIPIQVVAWHPETIVLGILFAAVAGALSALAPALAASRLAPAEAMRALPSLTHGSMSIAERLVPPLRRIPIRWRAVFRGIERSRLRSLSTVFGVVLAITLVLVSWGMLDTTQLLIERQFTHVQREDAELLFDGPASDARLSTVRAAAGVLSVEPFARDQASVSSGSGSYGSTLVALRTDTSMHGFTATGGGALTLSGDGVLVGRALKDKLQLAEGDLIDLQLPASGRTLHERIRGFVDEPMGTFVYMSLDALAASTGLSTPATGALVRYAPGADPAVMRDRLMALSGVAAFIDSRALARLVDQYMGLFYVFVGIMLALGGVMSFALIFITMSVNVSERTSEIATLRANGMTPERVSRLLSAENLLLTALGIVPGLAIGYGVAWAFMRSFSSDLFRFDLAVRPATFILIAAGVLVVALLSQRPALRVVSAIDIGHEIRVLSA